MQKSDFDGRLIAAAGHVTEVAGPVQALYDYLRRTGAHFSFAKHPFGFSGITESTFEHWHPEGLELTKRLRKVRLISIATDVLANILWFGLAQKSDVFVGIDNVNAFSGILLRLLGRTKKVVYYVIDYTPKRFDNRILNKVYHAVDRFVVRNADEIWNISGRIQEIRAKQGVPPDKNRVVNVGIDFSRIKLSETRRRSELVCISHLTESKGVQLVIRAMRAIRARVPDAKLVIIGTGPYESALRALVSEERLQDCVEFLGLMNLDQLMDYLPSSGVAMATYLDDINSITYYADPTKPKEYLACGLPIIITDVPWIAREIAERPMGICIQYKEEQLVEASVKLMTDGPFYDLCARNASEFVKGLDWSTIYDRAFAPKCA